MPAEPSEPTPSEAASVPLGIRSRRLTERALAERRTSVPGRLPESTAALTGELLADCVRAILSPDAEESAEGVAALETMVPALPALLESGVLSDDERQRLAIQLDHLACARIAGKDPLAPGVAGAHQGVALLRAFNQLDPDPSVRRQELTFSLHQAVLVFPGAVNPGVVCDLLSPAVPDALQIMRSALLASATLPRPAAPPRLVVAAATTIINGSPAAPQQEDPWTARLAKCPRNEAEQFAAAVLAHPSLSAREAGQLLAAMARTDHPRTPARMQRALETVIDALRTRCGHDGDFSVNPAQLAADIVAGTRPVQRLAALLAARTLNAAAGRGDAGADALAWRTLQDGLVDPASLAGPQAAVAAAAASFPPPSPGSNLSMLTWSEVAAMAQQPANVPPSPQADAMPESRTDAAPVSVSDYIARRLAEGLERIADPFSDEAARWAKEIGRKWADLAPGAVRDRVWSSLTLAFEILAEGRLPFSRPEILAWLLRNGAEPAAVEQELDDHLAALEPHLARVAAAPLSLPMPEGIPAARLNVTFVPGWRFGASIEELERARRQREWQPSHATNWLERDAVAVLADGVLCGWMKADADRRVLTTHVKKLPGQQDDPERQREHGAISAALSAVALAVAADSELGVEGEGLSKSVGDLGDLAGSVPLLRFAEEQPGDTASADQVRELAACAGWFSFEPGVEVETSPEATAGEGEGENEWIEGEVVSDDDDLDTGSAPQPGGGGRRAR